MNNNRWLISLGIVACIGSSTSAYAVEGVMDDLWLSVQAKVTAPAKTGLSGQISVAPYTSNSTALKFDSGKDACFMHLRYSGAGTHQYTVKVFCNPTGLAWERDENNFAPNSPTELYEMTDGSIWTYLAGFEFAANGKSAQGSPAAGILYFGNFRLTPKFNGAVITSVKASSPKAGVFTGVDQESNTTASIGTNSGTWKIKLVDKNSVPSEAIDCQQASDVGPTTSLCN